MLESVIALNEPQLPRALFAVPWRETFLVVGHFDGSLSVFDRCELVSYVMNPGSKISHLANGKTYTIVCFESGRIARFTLPLGLLDIQNDIGITVSGLAFLRDAIVVWGCKPKLFILHKFSLDTIREVALPYVPLRVFSGESGYDVVLNAGIIHHYDSDWRLIEKFKIPSPDEDRDPHVIDAARIGESKWLFVDREVWWICSYHEKRGFTVEVSANAPCPFIGCASTFSDAAIIRCQNGSVLYYRNDNVQVLESTWLSSETVSTFVQDNHICVALETMKVCRSHMESQTLSWDEVRILSKVGEPSWFADGTYVAHNECLGILNPCFDVLYKAANRITAILSSGTKHWLGLENGSLEIIEDLKLVATQQLAASPIIGIKWVDDTYIVAWSEQSVAIVRDTVQIVPSSGRIESVGLAGESVLAVKSNQDTWYWDLSTLSQTGKAQEDATMWYPCSWKIMTPYNIYGSNEFVPEMIGTLRSFDEYSHSVTVVSPEATSYTAPIVSTFSSLGKSDLKPIAETYLSKFLVSAYEDLVLNFAWSPHSSLYAKSVELLCLMLTPEDISRLRNSAGKRSLLLMGAIYPNIGDPVWLRQRLMSALESDSTDQLSAFKVLLIHPTLIDIPLDAVVKLGDSRLVIQYLKAVMEDLSTLLVDELEYQVTKRADAVSKCLILLAKSSLLNPEDEDFERLVRIAVQAYVKSERVPFKTFLELVMEKYPNVVKLHPDRHPNRRRLLVMTPWDESVIGKVVYLKTGNEIKLQRPPDSLDLLEFSADGKEAISYDKRYKWTFPGKLSQMFRGNDFIAYEEI